MNKKGQKEDKSKFLTKFVDYFQVKISLKLLVTALLHSIFFTDHLNHKTVNKTTCRTTTVNPCQLWAH